MTDRGPFTQEQPCNCCDCERRHGDQAESEEGLELIRLRAELRLEIERRDELLEGSSPAAIAELVASGMDAERRALREACARVADAAASRDGVRYEMAEQIAAAIRALT